MLHYFLRRQLGFSWLWGPGFIHLFLFSACFEMAHLRRLETKQVNLDIRQHESQRDRVKRCSVSWELSTFLFAHLTQYFSPALSSMYKSLCCVCVCAGFFFECIFFLLEYRCFTMLRYNEVNQVFVYMHPLPLPTPPSHPLRHHKAPLCYTAASHWLSAFPTVVYICPSCSLSSFPHCVRMSLLHICVFAVSLKLLSVSLLVGYSSQEIHCGIKGDMV